MGCVLQKTRGGPARMSGRSIEKRDATTIVLMAGLTVSPPPQEKRRQKLPPWLTNRFYVRCNMGSPSEEKAKHATAGVFCVTHTGSTLLPMSNAATQRDQETRAGLEEVRLEHRDGDIAAPKNMPASLGYEAQNVKSRTLPQETITACLSLGRILREIRARMLREGYNIPKGKAPENCQLP